MILSASLLAFGLDGTARAACAQSNQNPSVAATAPAIQFDERGDGTLMHMPSELVWQRCVLGQSWSGLACVGTPQLLGWDQALQAAEAHVQDGRSDWRMPNRNELASIVESRCFLPALDAIVFPDAPAGAHWTASPLFDALAQAWITDFDDGQIEAAATGSLLPVRLVRGGWDY
jgi:hypothetical protein